jgi:serine protease Do
MRLQHTIARLATHVVAATLVAATLVAGAVGAQVQSAATSDVFRRYADRVIKIQVVETGSAAKASIGSGFFVTTAGHIVTNYHVISSLIAKPGRYRAEFIDAGGTGRPVTVLAIDVVHDLAILGSGVAPKAWFTLGQSTVEHGDRLFSLGHPEDLGLSIVEGTYNGLLPHTLYPRIHVTGSLNHGMSGGPTIVDDGRVIGINVSTAGNQLSFLVPVDRAVALLERVTAPGAKREVPSLAQVGSQLRDYQDVYLRDMFAGDTKTIDLGPYRVITQPAPFFRCWADATRDAKRTYESVEHSCQTDDNVYITEDQSSGTVKLEHELIKSRTLNAPRFFALYSGRFGADNTPSGDEEHVTKWKCGTRNVRNAHTPMRAVLCLRRYTKLGELYDGVLKIAVLGRTDTGLVSTLTMSGASFENIERLSRRYLEQVAWR